jgi:hypothetical protein
MDPADGRDPVAVRRLLGDARGYSVMGRDGKRVGIFIEVADEGGDGERIAIRHDRVFLWRRELFPLANVTYVHPERRLVVIDTGVYVSEENWVHEVEHPQAERDWRGRIESYVASGNGDPGRHLRFISTTSGYELLEAEGRPPSPGSTVSVPEHLGSFLVMKLGPSPLPNDDRICAYLSPD